MRRRAWVWWCAMLLLLLVPLTLSLLLLLLAVLGCCLVVMLLVGVVSVGAAAATTSAAAVVLQWLRLQRRLQAEQVMPRAGPLCISPTRVRVCNRGRWEGCECEGGYTAQIGTAVEAAAQIAVVVGLARAQIAAVVGEGAA